jgi:catechol 2,3-dioxygenase-like lactoylglutathione lyase family enzyme
MTFRVLGTNHTSFTVSNLDRSMAPGHTLELIEYRAPAARGAVNSRPCDSGFAHVAFNVDDVPAAVDAVKHYGVKPIAQPVTIDQGPNKGRKVVYLRDWDGITIELIEAK